jgi:hypothetical protein
VNGNTPEWTNNSSWVHQESVIGPLLFLIWINDIPQIVSTFIKLFADDTKVYIRLQTDHVRQPTGRFRQSSWVVQGMAMDFVHLLQRQSNIVLSDLFKCLHFANKLRQKYM